jgi:hypothetical protein
MEPATTTSTKEQQAPYYHYSTTIATTPGKSSSTHCHWNNNAVVVVSSQPTATDATATPFKEEDSRQDAAVRVRLTPNHQAEDEDDSRRQGRDIHEGILHSSGGEEPYYYYRRPQTNYIRERRCSPCPSIPRLDHTGSSDDVVSLSLRRCDAWSQESSSLEQQRNDNDDDDQSSAAAATTTIVRGYSRSDSLRIDAAAAAASKQHQHVYESSTSSSSSQLEDSPTTTTSTWVYWEEQLDSSFDFRLFEALQPVPPSSSFGG